MILRSYAKLNLYLAVLNKRNDNYHTIDTIFEKINLFDTIVLKSRRDGVIRITSGSSLIPTDHTNLAYKSAKLLQDICGITEGVDIKITKRIPVAAGMGGGSSNAATVLVGLNKLWHLRLTKAKLVKYAAKIGADVPFFVYDYHFARGLGRGDVIKPLNRLKHLQLWHVLVVPKIKVATASVYKKWDFLKKAGLTKPLSNGKIFPSALLMNDRLLIGKSLFNSLEDITLRSYPEVNSIKRALTALGAELVLMSGSGPTVFGIVSSRKQAFDYIQKLHGRTSWQVFVARTI